MQRCVFCFLDEEVQDSKADLESKTLVVRDGRLLNSLWNIFPYVYRLPDSSSILLQQVCQERRWKEFGEESRGLWEEVSLRGSQCWNLWWRTSIMNPSRVNHLKSWQITNHIPNASNFCRKDVLARYLRRLRCTYKSIYDFGPLSFNLPLEYTKFMAENTSRQENLEFFPEPGCVPIGEKKYLPKGKKAPLWIAKPVGKSQGKGIIVFDEAKGFNYDEACVVQEYIYRPYLINGYKWDLRLYVCITCPNPLTIYAYREGITRFATKQYDLTDLYNNFSHLTNTSVNKQSPTYKKNKETIGYGCKWTLKQLRNFFKGQGKSDFFLWQRIWSILVLTIIGDGKDISRLKWNNSNFEFYGFDILVDERLKPQLLEVNVNPGLGSDTISTVDEEVKKPMLHDLFTLLGLPDGREFGNSESSLGCDKHDHLFDDEETILDQMLKSCKEVESLSPHKGYTYLLQSMIKERKDSNRNGTDRPYSCDKIPADLLLKCGTKLSYERLVTNKLLGGDATRLSRKIKKRSKGEPKKSLVEPQSIAPIAVRVPVLKATRERTSSKFPKNGPGLNLAPLDWTAGAPASSGNWVRIYPFDGITENKCRFQTEDSIRASVSQVVKHLNVVREAVRSSGSSTLQLDDEVYTTRIQNSGIITTDVWYPYL